MSTVPDAIITNPTWKAIIAAARRPADREIYDVYHTSKSVHKAGERFGVCGETFRSWMKQAGIRPDKSHWQDSDIEALRAYYRDTPPADFRVETVARALGRSVDSVSLKAGRLGFADPCRPKAKKAKADQSDLPWSRWVKHEHPRGMAGKHHSAESAQKISAGNRAQWEKAKAEGTGSMSPESRQKRSDRLMERNRTDPSLQVGYTRCKGGRRADLGGRYFRSRWEANVARYLNFLVKTKVIERWEYESETFVFEKITRGTRSYTPDFKIWNHADPTPYFWEVKGWMDQKSVTRLKRMKKYYPDVKVEVIDETRYRQIKKSVGSMIDGWEVG